LPVKEDSVKEVLASLPRGFIVSAAVLASLPTLALLLPLNLGVVAPATLIDTFLALYLLQLPLALYAASRVEDAAARLTTACGEKTRGRDRAGISVYTAAAAVPLGFIVPLVQLGHALALCGLLEARRLGGISLEVILNLMTLGLHTLIYASMLERAVATVFEDDGARS